MTAIANAASNVSFVIPAISGKFDKNLVAGFENAISAAMSGTSDLMQRMANATCTAANGGNGTFAVNMLTAAAAAFKAAPVEAGSIKTRWNATIKACTGFTCRWNPRENAFVVKAPETEVANHAKAFWATCVGNEWTAELPTTTKAASKTNISALASKIADLSPEDFKKLRAALILKDLDIVDNRKPETATAEQAE